MCNELSKCLLSNLAKFPRSGKNEQEDSGGQHDGVFYLILMANNEKDQHKRPSSQHQVKWHETSLLGQFLHPPAKPSKYIHEGARGHHNPYRYKIQWTSLKSL